MWVGSKWSASDQARLITKRIINVVLIFIIKVYHRGMRKHLDLVVLILCLGVTVGAWQWGIHSDRAAYEVLGQEQVAVAKKLDNYLEHVLGYGAAVTGLYGASDKVTDAELGEFVRTIMRGNDHPAILRFSVVEVVAQPGQDEPQYIVKKVVDQAGKIYVAWGQDLSVEAKRRKLIEQVVKTGKGTIGWVDQVSNIAEYQGAGFVASSPIYRGGQLVGLVNLVLSKEAIEQEIGSWVDDTIEWQWWVKDQGVVGAGATKIAGKKLTTQARVELVGETVWGVDLAVSNLPSTTWNIVLGLGTLFSFLLYAIVYALSSSGVRAELLAKEMTRELEKYKLALDSTSTHIIITDSDGVILYLNEAAEHTTGYSREEVLGKTPRIWGRQMAPDFYTKLWDTIKAKKQVFKGEMVNKRKNGELYTVAAIISPIVDRETGELVGYVGIEEDITERKNKAEEHAAHLVEMERINKLMIGRELRMAELKQQLAKYQKIQMKEETV